jgi:hypothetical protein
MSATGFGIGEANRGVQDGTCTVGKRDRIVGMRLPVGDRLQRQRLGGASSRT